MIDFDAVRPAYHTPQPLDDHVPTIEERVAAFERQRVQQARERGVDPAMEGLGEHGSLIGGPGNRPTRFEGGRRAEDMVRMPPMPLAWFSHPNATRRTPCPNAHRYLDTLSADHLAELPPPPGRPHPPPPPTRRAPDR